MLTATPAWRVGRADGTDVVNERHLFDTPTAVVSLRGNIVTIRCTPGAQIDLIAACQQMELWAEHRPHLGVAPPYGMLINVSSLKTISREAREYYRAVEDPTVVGAAIVVNSALARVIGNFVVGLGRPKNGKPVQLFQSEAEARFWLRGLLAWHDRREQVHLGA